MTLPVNPVKMIVTLASLRTTTKRLQGCQIISSTRFKKVFPRNAIFPLQAIWCSKLDNRSCINYFCLQ